jgi:aryl-alcohol dehydrogenase-like predicted oxidoreductase
MTLPVRQLGNSGIEVCAIGLGAMPMSLAGRPPEATALETLRTFLDGGGDFIDTANVYCQNELELGHNESLIFKALKQLHHLEVPVATKGGLRMHGDSWTVDGSPSWLRMSCENSMKNLNTHCIFLYQLHAPDPEIDILESVGELMRMQQEGMIRYLGVSNVTRKQIRRLVESAAPIVSVQNRCNLFHREDIDKGLVEFCRENRITYIAHSPVGGHYNHANFMDNRLIERVAAKHGASNYAIALAWLLQQADNILPIPGASKPESIANSLTALDISLDAEDLAELGKVGAQ